MGPRTAWLLLLMLPALVLPAPAPPPVDFSGDVTVEVPLWQGAASAGLLIVVAAALLGCAWCRRYKNCKPEQNGDIELFGARRPSVRPAAEDVRPVAEVAVEIEAAPDGGAAPAPNNNVAEDNNNGPISLRELQNIANNNATAYIVSENEDRNALGAGARAAAHSRESVVEFEPLPQDITPAHRPLYADWFVPQRRDFPRDRLQYIREIGRGSFGRIVEGELTDESGARNSVAVRILERRAGPAERAAFLRDAAVFRDASGERVLRMLASNLAEEPWFVALQLCDADLQQYLQQNRPHMCSLNERGVPLRLQTDIAAGLVYLHRRGIVYGSVWSGGVLVRTETEGEVRARLGYYGDARAPRLAPWSAPEMMAHASLQESASSEVWSLGVVVWEVCTWGDQPPPAAITAEPPLPSLPCVYGDHLYQVMQMCWNLDPERRPNSSQVYELLHHLHVSHQTALQDRAHPGRPTSGDFERRWQNLKPNHIPVVDEHVAIVHTDVHFSRDPGPSRSSSVSDTLFHDKSDSLMNLHGSLEDIRDADVPVFEPRSEKNDAHLLSSRLDDKVDPWLAEVIAGNADDVDYYRDVGDVIKNLDSILNSEKTSSSESSHQASPAREQLALNVSPQRPNPPSALVKSPGVSDFRSILEELPPDPEKLVEEDLCVVGARNSFEIRTPTGDVTPRAFEPDDVELEAISGNAAEGPSDTNEQSDSVRLTNEEIVKNDEVDDVTPATDDVGESKNEINVEHEVTDEHLKNVMNPTARGPIEHDGISSSREVTSDVQHERVRDDDTVRVAREFIDELISEAENDSRVRIQREVANDDVKLVNVMCVKDEETGEFDCRELKHVGSAHRVPSLKDLCAVRTTSSVTSFKCERKDCAESCDNLFNVQWSPDEGSRESSDESHRTREATEMTLPASILTLETENESSTRNKTPEDLSEGLDGSEKNSISDTEVLSADNDSTVYMDLKAASTDVSTRPIDSCARQGVERDISKLCDQLRSDTAGSPFGENGAHYDSTQYIDLPHTLLDISKFIEAEKLQAVSANRLDDSFVRPACNAEASLATSTPNIHDEFQEVDAEARILENAAAECESAPVYGSEAIVTRLRQQCVPDYTASPEQKSLEQSEGTEGASVVLGPFENCTLDYFTGIKTEPEQTAPQEELLAFSSNFVEFNLNSDVTFELDEAANVEEASSTRPGPSTPPNTPGYCFASLQDFEVNAPLDYEPCDLSHIQLTAKMAMADNENNFNIEYSSAEEPPPPPEPELDEMGVWTPPECEECPAELKSTRGTFSRHVDGFDESSMKALRDELELKLPLAQASGCEPIEEFMLELPPPPVDEDESEGSGRSEVVVHYRGDPGALSPIIEETDPQLNAYHSNINWTQRTDSSSSYLVPCNDSTDELTELVTAVRSEPPPSHPVHKDNNCEISMSTDSLNTDDGTLRDVAMPSASYHHSPLHLPNAGANSAFVVDEREEACPFILSPTADSCKVSTDASPSKTSKPTLPTDAKSSNTHGLSEAASIDSWCSNDTLFNVEDNFDVLVEEGEGEFSSDTLAKESDPAENTDAFEDSKSDDRRTPDSVTNDGTYTLVKELDAKSIIWSVHETNGILDDTTYSIDDDDELNQSVKEETAFVKNGDFESQIKLQGREMEVDRMRSPHASCLNMTPPLFMDASLKCRDVEHTVRPALAMCKMDSVDISCIKENFIEQDDPERGSGEMTNGGSGRSLVDYHFADIAKSITSTPLAAVLPDEPVAEPLAALVLKTPQTMALIDVPEFKVFCSSAEFKPQEGISPITNGEHSSERSPILNFSQRDSNSVKTDTNLTACHSKSSGYLGFEASAIEKPQDSSSNYSEKSSSDGHSKSDGYLEFKDVATSKPQEISSNREEMFSEGQSVSSGYLEFEMLAKVKAQNLYSNYGTEKPNAAEPDDSSRTENVSPLNKEHDSDEVMACSKGTESQLSEDAKENTDIKESSKQEQYFSLVVQPVPNTDQSSTANSGDDLPTVVVENSMGDIHTYVPNKPVKSGIEFTDDNCPDFSHFECSAQNKPQELSSITNQNVTDVQSENRAAYDASATVDFLSFERSAAMRPQDVSSDMKHSVYNSESSHNFNDTFNTFDSHPSHAQPGQIVNISDVSEPKDSTRDSHARGNDASSDPQSGSGPNIELSPKSDHSEHGDSHGNIDDDESDGHQSERDGINTELSVESDKSEEPQKSEDVAEKPELIAVDLLNNRNVPSTSSSSHPQEDLGFYEPIESKNDSLVSESEETNLHSMETNLHSVETNLDRDISIASTVESEPTTREMDSLENQLQLNEEIVHKTCKKDLGQTAETESVVDSEVERAIQELDRVIEANGVEDIRSVSPSSCASDEYRPMREDEKQTEQSGIAENEHSDMPTPSDVVGINIITSSFIEHEKNFSSLDAYLPLLNDIRFTGPLGDCMTTSFSHESPCSDSSLTLESELRRAELNASRLRAAAGGVDAWDSDSDAPDDSSSGEFVWKNGGASIGGGDGGSSGAADGAGETYGRGAEESDSESDSGDETEFVPSSWDSGAAPAKSSLKTLRCSPARDGKKRVVFKRQKYHCVYEYPREVGDECEALPDYSVYAGSLWEALGVDGGGDVQLSYAPAYAHAPMHLYKLPPEHAFDNNYGLPDEDFFISSSARPFELGIMSSTSQFFPGLHSSLKSVDSPGDDGNEDSESPSPLAKPAAMSSLDFTTPDSGVEDVTPGSTLEEESKVPSAMTNARCKLKLRAPDASSSSSESPSPSSPCWESLGGLRHTRDRLKLDLPPSPLNLTPTRHGRVFSFASESPAALVMTDETPILAPLPIESEDIAVREPTFSTFGKPDRRNSAEFRGERTPSDTDRPHGAELRVDRQSEANGPVRAEAISVEEALKSKEAVRGEGTVLDSGDEDSGIESSKATLERDTSRPTAT